MVFLDLVLIRVNLLVSLVVFSVAVHDGCRLKSGGERSYFKHAFKTNIIFRRTKRFLDWHPLFGCFNSSVVIASRVLFSAVPYTTFWSH